MKSDTPDAKLATLFLDMLAAEQGAGDNTLDAYRRDLEDLSAFLARSRQNFVIAGTQTLRDYLNDLDLRGFSHQASRGVCQRCVTCFVFC